MHEGSISLACFQRGEELMAGSNSVVSAPCSRADVVRWALVALLLFPILDLALFLQPELGSRGRLNVMPYIFGIGQGGILILGLNMAWRLLPGGNILTGRAGRAALTILGIAVFLASLVGLPLLVAGR